MKDLQLNLGDKVYCITNSGFAIDQYICTAIIITEGLIEYIIKINSTGSSMSEIRYLENNLFATRHLSMYYKNKIDAQKLLDIKIEEHNKAINKGRN